MHGAGFNLCLGLGHHYLFLHFLSCSHEKSKADSLDFWCETDYVVTVLNFMNEYSEFI